MDDRVRVTGLSAALRALLHEPGGAVLVSAAVDGDAFSRAGAEVFEPRALRKLLQAKAGPTVVVVAGIDAEAARALRESPPGLLVVVGPETAIPDNLPCPVLGPGAVLRVGEGELLVCAETRAELEALLGAIDRPYRLALCPTPDFLATWLADPGLRKTTVVGYIEATRLGPPLSRALRASKRPHVLVPLGVHAPPLDAPLDPSLPPAAGTFALERMTGPLFPAPNVLALVLRGQASAGEAPGPTALARWQQARRALPGMGALPGMESPLPGLPLSIPTAAFLAQRCLLGIERKKRLLKRLPPEPEMPAEDIAERAQAVLRSSSETLSDHESKVVLRGYGIHVTRQAVATSASAAAHFAETIGFPVVLKATGPGLRRKRELQAVVLDLATSAAVRRAHAQVVHAVEDRAPTVRLDGVLVAEMIGGGLDVHCGGLRTADGQVVLFGRPLPDLPLPEPVLAPAPIDPEDAVLLADAVLSRLPLPLRRASDPDVQALAELFLRLDRLFSDTGDRLLAVELNPVRLIAGDRRYVTLDARIVQQAHVDGA